MKPSLPYDRKNQSLYIQRCMVVFACALMLLALTQDTPMGIFRGVSQIILTRAGLITDSIMIGGLGGAFFNSGLVVLVSAGLLRAAKVPFSGISIACLFLMGGFSLFGKDIWNIFPIIGGGFLYSRYKREPFGKYIYISLFGTALAPVVTELVSLGRMGPTLNYVWGMGMGVVIGFILPPISAFTIRVHQGYNLYNVGFSAGLVGMVLASIFKSFGHTFEVRLEWSVGNNLLLGSFLVALFLLMLLLGFFWNGGSFLGLGKLMTHSGRTVSDFTQTEGLPVTLINMGTVGLFATGYVLLSGGELNGPTIGGILSICGFGAFGKHLKNIIPVMLGVVLSSFIMVWSLKDPNVQLAVLFSTGLAPIAGQFGWKWGIVAGVIHASVVLNVGFLHAGLNLYNNGFAAGLVCVVLVPLIEALQRRDEDI